MMHTKLMLPLALLACLGMNNDGLQNPLPAAQFTALNHVQTNIATKKQATTAKIQAAILLDVSGSMDGLIDQAKAQLWNMVNVMGKTRCDGEAPQIEIALYEYGRSNNDEAAGYVKKLSDFGANLDQISQQLFALQTNGGEEFCGQVIYTSIQDLKWDTASTVYKVIFIAGNEDFLQGPLQYNIACNLARDKGIIVNTIYCGNKMQGIAEHWNLSGECGNGSFTNINQNAQIEEIPTPFDEPMFSLNQQLNKTYLSYGANAEVSAQAQAMADEQNYKQSKSAAVKRVQVKGQSGLYNNAEWDLIDASEKDSSFYKNVDMKTLPESMQHISRPELKNMIDQKSIERGNIQKEIAQLSIKRENFLKAAKESQTGNGNDATLQTEIEKIILMQAKKFNLHLP